MIFIFLSLASWANTSAGVEICDFGALPKSKWASHSTAETNWNSKDGPQPRDGSPYFLRLDGSWKNKLKELAKGCPPQENQILQLMERANQSCSLYLRAYQFKDEGSILGDLGLVASKTTAYKREWESAQKKSCKGLLPMLKKVVGLSESTIQLSLEKISSDRCEELATKVDASRLLDKCNQPEGASAF